MPLTTTLLLAPLLGAPGDVALFLGTPGGAGDVVTVDETGASAPSAVAGLAGVVLLPVDASGRSPLTVLSPASPRRVADVAGAARVALPFHQGSLYRFRRDAAGGGADFGFFVVDAQGGARIVLERPGAGPAGALDPFHEKVGVDPEGDAILVATVPEAGGDLIEVDLVTGAAETRTQALPPLAFHPAGGRLLQTWGAAVAAEGLVRFGRAPGADGALVAVQGIAPPAWFDGGIAVSAGGAAAATVAGAGPDQAHVLCFGPAGDARALDPVPQALSGAGFLPESSSGPYLALGPDGALAAWCVRAPDPSDPTAKTREAWIGPALPAPVAPEHVTHDLHFVDTLDETGLIGFVGPAQVLLGVGEADAVLPGAPAEIEGLDLYAATLGPGGALALQNLSLTSGVAAEPFVKGEISTEDGVYLLPDGGVLALDEGRDLLGVLVPGTLGLQPVLPQTKALRLVESDGGRVFLHARHSTASVDERLYAWNPAGGAPKLLASLPDGVKLDRFARRGDGAIALAIDLFGKQWVARVDLVQETAELALTTPLSYGPALAFTPGGGLAASAGPAGGPAIAAVWLGAGGVLLPIAPSALQVLPGAG